MPAGILKDVLREGKNVLRGVQYGFKVQLGYPFWSSCRRLLTLAAGKLQTKPPQVTARVPSRWALCQRAPSCLLCAPGKGETKEKGRAVTSGLPRLQLIFDELIDK